MKQRENPIVNRLNKTKVEKYPDLRQEREDRLRQVRKREQAVRQDRVWRYLFTAHRARMSWGLR